MASTQPAPLPSCLQRFFLISLLVGAVSTAAVTLSSGSPVLGGSSTQRRDYPFAEHSKLPYGEIINHCTVPGTVALTFDDGPYKYTEQVLDLLDRYRARATFFVNGDNFGRGHVDNRLTPWPAILRRIAGSGHQLGAHTWAHQDMTVADHTTRYDQMVLLEDAFVRVLGLYPVYFRPPYATCEAACLADLGRMGYHVINFDLDTNDWLNDSPAEIDNSVKTVHDALANGNPSSDSFLVLAHDVHYETAHKLTEEMLQSIEELGYRAVTVGECLGDPAGNWYHGPAKRHTGQNLHIDEEAAAGEDDGEEEANDDEEGDDDFQFRGRSVTGVGRPQ